MTRPSRVLVFVAVVLLALLAALAVTSSRGRATSNSVVRAAAPTPSEPAAPTPKPAPPKAVEAIPAKPIEPAVPQAPATTPPIKATVPPKKPVKAVKPPAKTAAPKVAKTPTPVKPSVPAKTAAPVKPVRATPAPASTARRAEPLSPRKFVTIPSVPRDVKTYLVAGVTPVYTARGVRVESFRSPTDTVLLVQLDPGANVVRTLSLPRDTLLGSTGSRINSVLPRSGADALVRTVSAMTGVRIDAYLLVNLRGVREMTDAAGGVTLTVQKPMHYDDYAGKLHIHLQPGRQTLSGQRAEEFLRFRHDARGDIGRIDRTRDFLAALTLRLLTPDGLNRLPKVSAAIRANSLTTLSERDYQNILGFAAKRPKLQTFVLPGRNEGAYWRVDPARASGVLASFRAPVQASR